MDSDTSNLVSADSFMESFLDRTWFMTCCKKRSCFVVFRIPINSYLRHSGDDIFDRSTKTTLQRIIQKIMYIKVIVKAGTRKESIQQTRADHFEIAIKEKAERNMANKKVVELIATYLNIPIKKVRIVNGHLHSHKLLVIDN
jgi:uncharacterized protein YggU (UPF0235/DUF167 family)